MPIADWCRHWSFTTLFYLILAYPTITDWCRYWSFTTLTTVGYGDLVPQHQKVLFSFFFLGCVTVFCTVLAEVAGIVVDLDRFGRLEKLLKKGLSKELMDVIDTNNDGWVRRTHGCTQCCTLGWR